ncbi:thioredoxin-disulfide reductase [Bradyrhizobium sp. STM 3562]|uniref:thioredoxin-disulfide reductase n=1 Tax=Bradyrhizobium sp. STM 3562 TaxID=578924 RepID=UPI00388E8765
MQTHRSKVLIIGSGPAGYTAAIYAARANLAPILVTGPQSGGQLTITTDVENYPGFAAGVQGPWLMEQMRQQAVNVGVRIIEDMMTFVDVRQAPVRAGGELGDIYIADTLVVATGAKARWLGIPGEQEYSGRGVSACAVCDGIFFRDKVVAVVGGGNVAVEEALHLANLAARVFLIHRRNTLRAEKILQDRLMRNPKIKILWNSRVGEILGGGGARANRARAAKVVSTVSGETAELPLDGVFVAIGHDPASALFRGQLDMDEAGYIRIAPWSTRTSRPWVFSCGDVSDPKYRQAVTAAGMGCMAALEAERYVLENSPRLQVALQDRG